MTTTISEQIAARDLARLREISKTLRQDLLNPVGEIENLVQKLMMGGSDALAEDFSFGLSIELMNIGPKNDYNGVRSAAESLRKDWENEILHPALNEWRKRKAA